MAGGLPGEPDYHGGVGKLESEWNTATLTSAIQTAAGKMLFAKLVD